MINIGAGVTSYSIFIDGELINSGIVAIGGTISQRISVRLSG